jgi:hypothetical protein
MTEQEYQQRIVSKLGWHQRLDIYKSNKVRM